MKDERMGLVWKNSRICPGLLFDRPAPTGPNFPGSESGFSCPAPGLIYDQGTGLTTRGRA